MLGVVRLSHESHAVGCELRWNGASREQVHRFFPHCDLHATGRSRFHGGRRGPCDADRTPRVTALAIAIGIVLSAATAARADQTDGQTVDLPVSRVALFSSGVAYYEREGDVSGTTSVELRLRTEQINDIIKSLVVQDLDGGTVSVVRYPSRDPIDRTLKSFGVDISGNPSLGDLLNQLRGEPIEVGGARTISGVIVGVEQKRVVIEKEVIQTPLLNVLTSEGIQQVALTELGSLKLSNAKVDGELRQALATLATGHDADKKSVVIRFEGSGKRRARIAYLLEAPIWKTAYRLVLSEEKPPFLQGWATVENPTEEDWSGVRLSLISGRPISFRMDLYSPIYVPRPLEELELYASLRPPSYEGALEVAKAAAAPPPAPAAALGLRDAALSKRRGAGAMQEGRGGAHDEASEFEAGIELDQAGVVSVAEAQSAGELFEYRIGAPVTLPRQSSAMLPILNQAIGGEKVSIYNPATHAKYPLNGLELVNATESHLMQGPITIFDAGVYAGDAKLPDLKPGEKRLVAYALDLGVEVSIKQPQREPEPIVSLRAARGVLFFKTKLVDTREYVVKNKDRKPRTVLIEQPYGDEWTLVEPAQPYERAPGLSRFKMQAAAGQTATLIVKLEQLIEQSVALSNMNDDQVRFYLRAKAISPALQAALQKLIELRSAVAIAERQREAQERLSNEAVAEQARIRENLKTLAANSDAHRRQEQKFDELETRIEQHRAATATARQNEEQARLALEGYLMQLTVE